VAAAVVHSRGVRRLPHAPDGRVRTVGAGYRSDAHQHVGVGHVSGTRVTRAVKKKDETKNVSK